VINVGLDFGTSNSSIAAFQDGNLRLFQVDPGNPTSSQLLRSFIYLDRNYDFFVGSEAIHRYLESETGRPSFWQTRSVGTIKNVWGGTPTTGGAPIIEEREVVIEVDVAAKGRLLQSIKTALRRPLEKTIRDEWMTPRIQVFERLYPVEDLIAMLMHALRDHAEKSTGEQVEGVVLGRPVKFSDDDATEANAQRVLAEAARFAGFKHVDFELEPVAAAYTYHRTVSERELVMVFDFGGGTLDFTVMEVGGAEAPRVLATHGVLVGGDDLDRALMRPIRKHFGDGATFRDGRPLPAHLASMLESWQTMVNLSRPRYREMMRDARGGSDPRAIKNLEELVRHNLGFQLFQELEQSKIRLSGDELTDINFAVNGIRIVEPVSRREFETFIWSELEQAEAGIQEVLLKSGLKAEQIGAVLRTGGTSEVPAIIQLLANHFDPGKIRAISPFTSIVGGLAIRASEMNG
jgi:hypothetical chaperone protein